jgi:Tn3 transposase DDE domain-containing protein
LKINTVITRFILHTLDKWRTLGRTDLHQELTRQRMESLSRCACFDRRKGILMARAVRGEARSVSIQRLGVFNCLNARERIRWDTSWRHESRTSRIRPSIYKMDRQQHYANLDPILSGTIKPHVIRNAWDETVRVIASMEERIVSPSMVLQRLGSYARQNSFYQTVSEIGRVQKRSTF